MEFVAALLLFATCVALHVFALHLDTDPIPALEEIVYPSSHAEQSTLPASSHNVPPLPPLIAGVPLGQVQVAPVH